MVYYYDPKRTSTLSLFAWEASVLSFVFSGREYWFWVAMHTACVTLCRTVLAEYPLPEFPWDVASIMQYFMTFFVTFYNGVCYARYMNTLYPACTMLVDNATEFAQELNDNLSYDSLRHHKFAAAKYILAAVHEFFTVVTGGSVTKSSWRELVKKGILTSQEVDILRHYPGERTTWVLVSWAMLVVRSAVADNVCWQPRSQQSVHIYNRLNACAVKLLKACQRVGHTMALPIPFAFFHLMNLTLLFNILVLAIIPAFFRTYGTVPIFSAALLIVMGLKEIAAALADPFGEDSVDFPIPEFIDHAFDRACSVLYCLLDAEHKSSAVRRLMFSCPWKGEQLLRRGRINAAGKAPHKHVSLIDMDGSSSNIYAWSHGTGMSSISAEKDLPTYLKACLRETVEDTKEEVTQPEDDSRLLAELELVRQCRKERRRARMLIREIRALQDDIRHQRFAELGLAEGWISEGEVLHTFDDPQLDALIRVREIEVEEELSDEDDGASAV